MGVTKTIHKLNDDYGLPMRRVNAKSTQSGIRLKIEGIVFVSVAIVVQDTSGSGTRSTWTLRGSNDGSTYSNLMPVSVTVLAGASTDLVDVSAYSYLEVCCTSASSYSTELVNIVVSGATS